MKLTTNFQLQEFVHPDIYEVIGERCADFLNPTLAMTAQSLREKFGSIIVNDWLWGGEFEDSGLRLPHGGVGASLSAHKFGCAMDLKFDDTTPLAVQTYIINNQDAFPHITRLENAMKTKTWLHVEVGQRHRPVKVFNP